MTVSESAKKQRLPKLATVGFFCTLATLIACLGWTVATRRSIAAKVERLKKELSALQSQSRQHELLRKQSDRDQDVLIRVFRQFRSADDIPVFGGHRIISNLIDDDSVVFYVPDGNHKLDIHASWKPLSTGAANSAQSKPANSDSNVFESGEQSWSIPLIAEHGYRFHLTRSSPQSATLGWKLESNSKEFTPASDTLSSLPPIRPSGGSWSSLRIARFPNQPELRFLINPARPENPSRDFKHPVRIGRWTKTGRLGEKYIQIAFELMLSSDNSPVVTALDAETLAILQRTELIPEYLGDGLYRLKTD